MQLPYTLRHFREPSQQEWHGLRLISEQRYLFFFVAVVAVAVAVVVVVVGDYLLKQDATHRVQR